MAALFSPVNEQLHAGIAIIPPPERLWFCRSFIPENGHLWQCLMDLKVGLITENRTQNALGRLRFGSTVEFVIQVRHR